MPTPNFSDAYFLQWAKDMTKRVVNLEKAFNGIKDANGITRVRFGATPGTDDYGVIAYDDDGNVRVQLGGLANGDYGISLTDADGNPQELLPLVDGFLDSTISTDSTAYSAGSGSPSITVPLESSGDAIIMASAYVGTNDVNVTGFVGLSIDGDEASPLLALGAGSTELAGNISTIRKLSSWLGSTLAPNVDHTFALQQASSTSGQTVNFSAQSLLVWPI